MPRLAAPSIGRAEWLAARALLASRRLRPFLPLAAGIAASVLLAAGWWLRAEWAGSGVPNERPAVPAAMDTVALRTAQGRIQRELRRLDTRPPTVSDDTRPAEPSQHSATGQPERDSLATTLRELDVALDRAAKSPLAASYRTLARTAALRSLGAVSVLVDTLDLLDDVRRTLDPVAAPQREFAQLSERTQAIGASLQAIGQARRLVLHRRLALLGPSGGTSTDEDSVRWQMARDSALARAAAVDSQLRVAKQWHADQAATETAEPPPSGAIAASLLPVFGALFLAGVAVFTCVLILEARRPTIAHAREAERVTGLPVLATLRESSIPPEGRARLQAGGGADPFRMVYLALTVGEPRVRAICMTGGRPALVAASVGQLAVSAAAEEQSTLVMDLAAGGGTAAQYFGWKDEPGFTEAIAGVRLWREVATPIGASEGIDIDLVSAGAPRADTADAVATEANRREYLAFLGEHDFTALAAPTSASAILASRVAEQPNTVLVVEAARTRIARLRSTIQELAAAEIRLVGLLLFEQ